MRISGKWVADAGLWVLLFLVSGGLGYPVLNRFDPTEIPAMSDTAHYAQLVTSDPEEVEGHWRFRALVPLLARAVLRIFGEASRVGSWDSVNAAILVVNAALTATSGLLLTRLGLSIASVEVGLIGTFLFFLNFNISNWHVAGGVDSAEACLLLALVYALYRERWWLLPFLGLLGPVAKETYVPLGLALTGAWLLTEVYREEKKPQAAAWSALMLTCGMAGGLALRGWLGGDLRWPWQIAADFKGAHNIIQQLGHYLATHGFWFGFVWLLPLAVWRLTWFPRPWVAGVGAGALTAILLGAWHGSGGPNVQRAVFNIAGPLLSLSAASLLVAVMRRAHADPDGHARAEREPS